MAQEVSSPFFKLPLELREQIYGECLQRPHYGQTWRTDFTRPPSAATRALSATRPKAFDLLAVNRQSREEATEVHYRECVFFLWSSDCMKPEKYAGVQYERIRKMIVFCSVTATPFGLEENYDRHAKRSKTAVEAWARLLTGLREVKLDISVMNSHGIQPLLEIQIMSIVANFKHAKVSLEPIGSSKGQYLAQFECCRNMIALWKRDEIARGN